MARRVPQRGSFPLIGPDVAGRAALGDDDFLAYFQGEVGRYFLLAGEKRTQRRR